VALRLGWSSRPGCRPGRQGLGIGYALMQVCLDRARAAGAAVLCLHTAEFMTTAAAMYQAMGFRRVPSPGDPIVRGAPPARGGQFAQVATGRPPAHCLLQSRA
jgi:hypothetical protein